MNANILLIIIAVVVILILVVAAIFMRRKRQSEELQEKFGPEYDYTVNKIGDQREAEAELEKREKRIEALEIRELSVEERNRYQKEWEETQVRFVDEPKEAVEQADRLIQEVMKERGFPIADFEQRAADVSVLYPNVVPNYRQAHEIALRSESDGASTEDLRQAMVYYRSLFEELLHEAEKKEQTK